MLPCPLMPFWIEGSVEQLQIIHTSQVYCLLHHRFFQTIQMLQILSLYITCCRRRRMKADHELLTSRGPARSFFFGRHVQFGSKSGIKSNQNSEAATWHWYCGGNLNEEFNDWQVLDGNRSKHRAWQAERADFTFMHNYR